MAHRRAAASNIFDRLNPARSLFKGRSWPIDQPPFYAAPVCAGITYTFGGVAIDADSRVLSLSGAPIVGLYAAGVMTSGLEGRNGATYIGGLMKGLVFGIRAAEHVEMTRR